MSVLADIDGIVLDMDGVIWSMDDPIPHAREAIDRSTAAGKVVCYLTNNSSMTRANYVAKLARFGIHATVDDIMTSAYATALLLKSRGCAGRTAVVIGEQGLRDELYSAGVEIVSYREGDRPDYVIVGWDRSFTYTKLAEAHGAVVRGGARFIATNRDSTYPDAGGRTLPGGGSLVAALATSTGVEPETVGKPSPYALELILRARGIRPERCLVVGDRLDTDIASGRRAGAVTALVLTGLTSAEHAAAAVGDEMPHYVWPNLSLIM